MHQSTDSIDGMTWWAWLNSIRGDDSDATMARRLGVSPSAVGRWKKSTPDPARAALVARAYGRPVLEAFVAAGFLTSEEAGERPSAPPSLAGLDDDALLDEVRRRMRGDSDGRQPEAEKSDDGSKADVVFTPEDLTVEPPRRLYPRRRYPSMQQRAARHGKLDIPDEQRRQDQAGDESQDPGWPDEDQDSEDWDD